MSMTQEKMYMNVDDVCAVLGAVSYTHLDVYKRQEEYHSRVSSIARRKRTH